MTKLIEKMYVDKLKGLEPGDEIELVPLTGEWEDGYSKHLALGDDIDTMDLPDIHDDGAIYVRRLVRSSSQSGHLADLVVFPEGEIYVRWYSGTLDDKMTKTTRLYELATFDIL